MKNVIKVFIDTNIIKFSATKQMRIIPVNKPTRNWYEKITGYQLNTLGYVNPNDRLSNGSEIKIEAELLSTVAELAKSNRIELFEDREMMIESMGLPNTDSSSGRFYNAPIKIAAPPLKYGRVIIGPSYMGTAEELALNFLKGVTAERFKNLQKVTGAYQGNGNFNINQLRDAFLLWSAEHNNADYFLTLDFKLIKMVKRDRKYNIDVVPIRPSELLNIVSSK
jgi:hypothetical protein